MISTLQTHNILSLIVYLYGFLMKNIIIMIKQVLLFLSLSLFFSISVQAEDEYPNATHAFISDDLFIYMHAGPGTQYKILGSLNAGEEIKATGEREDDYSQILNNKNRLAWVESKYVKSNPGIRATIEILETKMANASDFSTQLDGEVNDLKSTLEISNNKNKLLIKEVSQLKSTLADTTNQLKGQGIELEKQWFFNGAIVLIIGLIFGLVIPKLFSRRANSMDSWK